jgi:integrase
MNLKAGDFSDDPNFMGYASLVVDGLDDALDGDPKRQRTIQEEIAIKAYHALEQAARRTPKLLSSLWTEYCTTKGIDVNSRSGKREQTRWLNIFALIGEQTLDNPATTIGQIHAGLDQYTEQRLAEGVKVQSVKREYGNTLSALRAGSKKYRLGWVIEPNLSGVKDEKVPNKAVLREAEQIAVAKHCLDNTETPDLAACVILMIQTGAMASEISRLDWKETQDDLLAVIPQIALGKDGKTEERDRVAPIVLGRDYLLKHLGAAIELCRNRTDSNVSHRIKKLLVTCTGNPALSAHCLRHTLKANGDVVNANASHISAIGGWAGSNIGKHQLRYGRDGLVRDEGFIAVRDTSLRIHDHIIKAVGNESNVVSIAASKPA